MIIVGNFNFKRMSNKIEKLFHAYLDHSAVDKLVTAL